MVTRHLRSGNLYRAVRRFAKRTRTVGTPEQINNNCVLNGELAKRIREADDDNNSMKFTLIFMQSFHFTMCNDFFWRNEIDVM
jgi:hypothetical protein